MTTNPRPRPALSKAPSAGHPAAIQEPSAAPVHLGGATSDVLRGKNKKNKKSTLRPDEAVDVTVAMPKSLKKRLRNAAKAADVTIDEYVQAVLDKALP